MGNPEPSTPVSENQVDDPRFRAVQGDTAITCVDWQAFHSWQADDPAFTGVITVVDHHGGQQTMANWPTPTDAAADTSLGNTGWQRVGPWNPDNDGRRSAPVNRQPNRRGRSSVATDTGPTKQQGTSLQKPNPGPPDDGTLTVDGRHKPPRSAGYSGTEIGEVPTLPWPAFDAQ